MATDWYDIKFLESATNVRQLIGRSTGRTPSAKIAREIAVCLQQGRFFFEAAADAPIQIRPLLIYYGVVAFGQAVVVARRNASLSTLARAHGLTDITPLDRGIESLLLRCESAGTFQEFNDAIAPLGRIWYFNNSMPCWFEKPFDLATVLSGQQISIMDVLSRLPGLSEKYSQTFGFSAKIAPIMLQFDAPNTARCTLRIDDAVLYVDRAGLVAAVQKWRADYPFLNRWRFIEASHAWGFAVLIFDNADKQDEDDLSNLIEANNSGFAGARAMMGANPTFVPAHEILPPLSGGYIGASAIYAMQPLGGAKLSEHSLQFLGSFLLGSLVRYRPQIWQNSISRSVTAQSPADDRSLPLLEEFLDDVLKGFPIMVVRVIDYQRVR